MYLYNWLAIAIYDALNFMHLKKANTFIATQETIKVVFMLWSRTFVLQIDDLSLDYLLSFLS